MLTSRNLQTEFLPSLVHLSLTRGTGSLVYNRLRQAVLAVSVGQRYLKNNVGSGETYPISLQTCHSQRVAKQAHQLLQ